MAMWSARPSPRAASGRWTRRAAKAAPGVLAIVTAENAGKLDKGNFNTAKLLGGPEIDHYHQAIAVVVADTFEQARAAAELVRVDYTRAEGRFDLKAATATAVRPSKIAGGGVADSAVGDFDGAFAAAPVQLDATYTTPDQSHAMMEPHASIAAWSGDKLTLWTSNQMIDWSTSDLAKTLGIAKEKVRLISPFIGGGFGAKLWVRADALLAALGARAAGRPVKVALPRALIANNTVHRPATIQRIRIGATKDGKITAIGHESWSGDLPGGGPEVAVMQTRALYAGANRLTKMRLAVLDLPEANAMRAPGEAPGMMALEIAIDEMAEKLGLDPVEFRIINDTQTVPDNPGQVHNRRKTLKPNSLKEPESSPVPFSQRQLVECLRIGAERFGWNRRHMRPASAPRGTLAGRSGRCRRIPRQPPHEVGRACPARQPRHGDCRDRHDRYWHWQLHGHRANCGRDDGRSARKCGGAPRRLDLSGLMRLGRTMGRQQLKLRRLCGMCEAARGRGAESGFQLRRCGFR